MTYSDDLCEHWPDGAPDWIEALAKEADLTSGNRAAIRVGMSNAAVSQLLRGKYKGDLDACADKVGGVLLAQSVDCPSLGELPRNECRHWRELSRSYQTVNALKSRMYRACNRCPINQNQRGKNS